MIEKRFKISNLTCEACVKLSVAALKKIPGVTEATVDLDNGLANMRSSEAVPWEEIEKALGGIGQRATELN